VSDSAVAGVYEIMAPNGHRYVGSSVCLARRWATHRRLLSAEKHHAPGLQRAWRRFGGESFTFAVLELVADVDHLGVREQFYITRLRPQYNVRKMAIRPLPSDMIKFSLTDMTEFRLRLLGLGGPDAAEAILDALALFARKDFEGAMARLGPFRKAYEDAVMNPQGLETVQALAEAMMAGLRSRRSRSTAA
jgi:hypothetical protein